MLWLSLLKLRLVNYLTQCITYSSWKWMFSLLLDRALNERSRLNMNSRLTFYLRLRRRAAISAARTTTKNRMAIRRKQPRIEIWLCLNFLKNRITLKWKTERFWLEWQRLSWIDSFSFELKVNRNQRESFLVIRKTRLTNSGSTRLDEDQRIDPDGSDLKEKKISVKWSNDVFLVIAQSKLNEWVHRTYSNTNRFIPFLLFVFLENKL